MQVPRPPEQGKILLTLPEVAYLTDTKFTKLNEMLARGELPGVVRIGRRVKVHRPTLEKWLEKQARGGDAA